MVHHYLFFILLQVATWPLRFLPYTAIHRLGRWLGSATYYLVPKYRKRTLSNLALILPLTEQQLIATAKASLQNLMITCLEYAKFASEKEIHSVVTCENPETAAQLMNQGTPVIFFCGHQANWEVLFLEGSKRMPGVAIGRPIKNAALYRWILSIRQKHGGKIVAPKNAIKEGLRGLKSKAFLGIVSDQGMPDSGYSSPFLGKRAWTSPMAAILSHRTGSPIVVATTRREKGKYIIHYSEPIWPDQKQPLIDETDRLMKAALGELERTICERPGEWLWSHNRWKQQTPGRLKKPFRHESILIILPEKSEIPLGVFREIYPTEFITVYAPKGCQVDIEANTVSYSDVEEVFVRDFQFKLVFDLTNNARTRNHFKRLAAFTVISYQEIMQSSDFSESLKRTVLKAYAP